MWPDEADEVATMQSLMLHQRKPLPEKRREPSIGFQPHGGPAFDYNDHYFSLLQVLDMDVNALMATELAVSLDGLVWQRPFRTTPFSAADGGENFDIGTLWTNATSIFLEDEIRFYYGAYVEWHVVSRKEPAKRRSGIGLATMPLDRFAGLRPIEEIGKITLKPVNLSECKCFTINADASHGSVRAELLDGQGLRVEGFNLEQVTSLTGDNLRHEVSWETLKLPDRPNDE